MPGQIAIFEGYDMPRKRKRKHSSRKGSGMARRSFSAAAKKCSRIARRKGRKGSFQACMKRMLKKGGRRRRRR